MPALRRLRQAYFKPKGMWTTQQDPVSNRKKKSFNKQKLFWYFSVFKLCICVWSFIEYIVLYILLLNEPVIMKMLSLFYAELWFEKQAGLQWFVWFYQTNDDRLAEDGHAIFFHCVVFKLSTCLDLKHLVVK